MCNRNRNIWFKDGGFYASLPIHKLFFILPLLLKNARNKFVTYDQVIDGAAQELKQLPGLQDQLLKISDSKGLFINNSFLCLVMMVRVLRSLRGNSISLFRNEADRMAENSSKNFIANSEK